jgi:hypothetical protein
MTCASRASRLFPLARPAACLDTLLTRHGSALCVALLALVSGCIEGIIVDELQSAATLPDAGADELDASESDPEPEAEAGQEPVSDAAKPMPPTMDAGAGPSPSEDAASDASREAGAPVDASAGQDAACSGARCDAGAPPGPCASCGVSVLIRPADLAPLCDNGAPQTCWMNPDGQCTEQCPNTGSCTKDDPGACGAGRFCYFPRGDCGASSAGYCASSPKDCATLSAPACGCDGATYTNTCFAALAGTAVRLGPPAEACR